MVDDLRLRIGRAGEICHTKRKTREYSNVQRSAYPDNSWKKI